MGLGMSTGEQAILHAVAGGVSGGINSALTSGDVGLGIATGAVSAGAASYVGGSLPDDVAIQFLSRTAMGGVTGGMTSSLYGGSFMHGFKNGAASAAYGYFCNHLKGISMIRFRAFIQSSVTVEDLIFDVLGYAAKLPTSFPGVLLRDFYAPNEAGVSNEHDLILKWQIENDPEYSSVRRHIQELRFNSLNRDPMKMLRNSPGQLYYRQGK
jgi:hypothetical protein